MSNYNYDKRATKIKLWNNSMFFPWALTNELNNPKKSWQKVTSEKKSKHEIEFVTDELKYQNKKSTGKSRPGERLQKQTRARLFFLGWENDVAHRADVPRAVRFCELQFGERRHDAAGEVSEGGDGRPDGLLEHLPKKTDAPQHLNSNLGWYSATSHIKPVTVLVSRSWKIQYSVPWYHM